MGLWRPDFRYMMFYDYNNYEGLTSREVPWEFEATFGHEGCIENLCLFSGLVNLGEAGSFDDEHRYGTPATAVTVTVTNIETADKWIRAEPRFSTREIQEGLSIGTAATMSILHDLRIRKQCARWVPHSLTDEQRRGRVEWCELKLRLFNGGRSNLTCWRNVDLWI